MTPPPNLTRTTVSDAALNRATLARQHLLERTAMSTPEMIEHLVGMQAQAPYPPYVGLWTRLRDFSHDDLGRRLQDGSVTRILLQRGTVHLVTAADCLALRPLLQPVIERMYVSARRVRAAGDPDVIAELTRRLLADHSMTPTELGTALAEHLPDGATRELADIARARVPLVQLPPRAVWGVGGVTRYAIAEHWLRADPTPMDLPDLIRRYLAAFGPASVADMQAWSGLTRLCEVTAGMSDLVTVRTDSGRELLDLPDASWPDPDVPAPARFLPAFDNVVLAHADRSRLIRDSYRPKIFSSNGIVAPTILTGGRVTGVWRFDDGVVAVTAFERLPDADVAALHTEGIALARFLAPAATPVDVRFE